MMATTTPAILIPARYLSTSATPEYTVTPASTDTAVATVDAIVLVNVSSTPAVVSANIVESGGTPGASNRLLDSRELAPGESYLCLEIIAQALSEGASLYFECSTGNSVVVRASGRVVTL